jgi:serine/threonine protein kinase
MFDNDANLILIDYGLCKPFKINETHIDEGSLAEKFEGNILFASPFQLQFLIIAKNICKSLQFMATSRRDDIYSLAYLLIYMLNGG